MSDIGIVDAHLHVGQPGVFFAPETSPDQLLATMDLLGISHAVCTDHLSIAGGCPTALAGLRDVFERSGKRIHYLAVFNPLRPRESLSALERHGSPPGLVGLKIHPSFHRTPAESASYEPAWRFASEHNLPILTHSWSVSEHNPVQRLATPERFERFVRRFPGVRLVLGHAGGRGSGRDHAVRMVNEHPNVYLDFAGDIFCYGLIETLVASAPVEKILFGSDFPWLDPRANLTRVLLADINASAKTRILRDNALAVYRIGTEPC